MKKIRKILLFSLLGIILVGIILGFALGGANCISSFVAKMYFGYMNFEWNQDTAIKILVYGIFTLFFLSMAITFAIQIRRKKSKVFPIYGFFLLLYLLFIVSF